MSKHMLQGSPAVHKEGVCGGHGHHNQGMVQAAQVSGCQQHGSPHRLHRQGCQQPALGCHVALHTVWLRAEPRGIKLGLCAASSAGLGLAASWALGVQREDSKTEGLLAPSCPSCGCSLANEKSSAPGCKLGSVCMGDLQAQGHQVVSQQDSLQPSATASWGPMVMR